MYEIRICKHNEKLLLLDFIKSSWNSNHIFLRKNFLINFQHFQDDQINFVVAYHIKTKKFHGILGFISPSFYSYGKVKAGDCLWLTMWKVEKNLAETNSLGTDLLNFLETKYIPKSLVAIGINQDVKKLYKLLGFKIKIMKQWFIPNLGIDKFIIGSGIDKSQFKFYNNSSLIEEVTFEQLFSYFSRIKNSDEKLSEKYIIKRYKNHPHYKYQCVIAKNKTNHIIFLAIVRVVNFKKSKALRIIEFWNNQNINQSLGNLFQKYLVENNLEYIDFLETGWSSSYLKKCGFQEVNDEIFVPHLFEPFYLGKTEVSIAIRGNKTLKFTKGDSDLDRPNK